MALDTADEVAELMAMRDSIKALQTGIEPTQPTEAYGRVPHVLSFPFYFRCGKGHVKG